MNVLEHYVTEIIGEPYYDDYGSGNYHWWLKVKLYVMEASAKQL